MPIFIQFDEAGFQQAVMNCQKSPGSDWVQAPKEFDWGHQYRLVKGAVVEMTQADLDAQRLNAAREEACHNIAFQLANVMEKTPGLSRSERETKAALGRLAEDHPDELTSLLMSTNTTLEDFKAEAHSVDQALLALEIMTKTAPAQLETCTTLEALEKTKNSLLEALTQQLTEILGGNHD